MPNSVHNQGNREFVQQKTGYIEKHPTIIDAGNCKYEIANCLSQICLRSVDKHRSVLILGKVADKHKKNLLYKP